MAKAERYWQRYQRENVLPKALENIRQGLAESGRFEGEFDRYSFSELIDIGMELQTEPYVLVYGVSHSVESLEIGEQGCHIDIGFKLKRPRAGGLIQLELGNKTEKSIFMRDCSVKVRRSPLF